MLSAGLAGLSQITENSGRTIPPTAGNIRVAGQHEQAGALVAESQGRYQTLVKLHQPDANWAHKAAEERLKSINQAYSFLKAQANPAKHVRATDRLRRAARATPDARTQGRQTARCETRISFPPAINPEPTDTDRMPTPNGADAAKPAAITLPDIKVKARQTFGIDSDMEVPAFSRPTSVRPTSTRPMSSIPTRRWRSCAGFAHNRRVMVQGYHGTGKSTHIEQVAARLNWPMHPHQPRRAYQPHRPDRPRRDRAARRPAGDRVPRRPAALGAAAPERAGVRRI